MAQVDPTSSKPGLEEGKDDSWTGVGPVIPPKVGGEFHIDAEVLKGDLAMIAQVTG